VNQPNILIKEKQSNSQQVFKNNYFPKNRFQKDQ